MASLHLYKRQLSTRIRTLPSTLQSFHYNLHYYSTATPCPTSRDQTNEESGKKWVTLPPFAHQFDPSSIGREIAGRNPKGKGDEPVTAAKWVQRCCPHLPMALVHKLFRLRQVRKEVAYSEGICAETQSENKVKRVPAKYALVSGDVVLLPISVEKLKPEIEDCSLNEDEVNFIHSLVLYKDPAIIVVNKPPGMPVQGGVGIIHCIDKLAAMFLKYEYSEPPRLVHRLDRDSSGILVLGRTQTSATILHSIFREKTSGVALRDRENIRRALQKKYWALVIGTPRHSRGRISAPLAKIVLEDGKSERITIARDESTASQHALTEYKVIKSSHGYTWLELQPLTGRKHQIRVHCAEVLGTPIVGDYKYGWKAHKNWEPVMPCVKPVNKHGVNLPFGLESGGGSVCEKQPHLHLHCRQMNLPDVSSALKHLESSSSSDVDLSKLEMLDLVAPVQRELGNFELVILLLTFYM